MKGRLTLAALAAVFGLAAAEPAAACHPVIIGAHTRSEHRVTMSDGVEIAATLFMPVGDHGCDAGPVPETLVPGVMMLHGLGGTRNDLNPAAETYLASRGYAVLTFDARAHGASGGLFDVDGPREIADVRELFEWFASRSGRFNVGVDRARIGGFGISYGGGAVWRATVEGVPFATIEPVITWTDLREALAPQGVAKSGLIAYLGSLVPPSRYAPEPRALLADALAARNIAALRRYLGARSSRDALSRLRVPTFILHGRRDFLFDMEQAFTAYRLLAGPKRLYLGDLGHPPAANPPAEAAYYFTQGREWFDRFLLGVPNGIDKRPPIELARDPWTGTTVKYRSIPATRRLAFAWTSRSTLTTDSKAVRNVRLPRQALETFGSPVVRVTASTATRWPHIVAVLSVVTSRGETVIADGAVNTASLGRKERTFSIRLFSTAVPLPKGSRLRVTLASTSTAQSGGNLVYAIGAKEGQRLRIASVKLSVPVLRRPVSP